MMMMKPTKFLLRKILMPMFLLGSAFLPAAVASAFVTVDQKLSVRSDLSSSASARQRQQQQHYMMLEVSALDTVCDSYNHCLDLYKLPTQMITASTFAGLGDVLAQTTSTATLDNSKKNKKIVYNPTRTFQYMLKGLGGGILWGQWYEAADSVSEGLLASVGMFDGLQLEEGVGNYYQPIVFAKVATAILFEQVVICPLLYTFWDIPVPALLNGSPPQQIPSQVSNKLGKLLIANAKLWTIMNAITFSIPEQYRVLFSSGVDVIWQSILSTITSQEIVISDKPITITASMPDNSKEEEMRKQQRRRRAVLLPTSSTQRAAKVKSVVVD